MKTVKKTFLCIATVCCSQLAIAQTTGTIGKNTYPILGKYTGKCSLGASAFPTPGDSVYYYSKIVNDTLLATHIVYKKGVISQVDVFRIKYQHQNISIEKPEEYMRGEYRVILEAKNGDNSSKIERQYTEKMVDTYNSQYMRCYNFFPNKEAAEKFYNNLMSGTSSETTTQNNTTTQTTQVKAETEEVKIKVKNTGNDVAEMYYQKSPGSKDLTSFRVQKGQSSDLKIGVGCSLFYNVKGSKGPLILTATKALDGSTQVVN